LLDRVDLRIRMESVATSALMDETGESTDDVRARVANARDAARQRWAEFGWSTNAEVPGPALRQKFRLPPAALRPVERALRKGAITARGADRALRVAWSLADLAGAASPSEVHVATALQFRDRGLV
jgi:magnesium chelatase family protein